MGRKWNLMGENGKGNGGYVNLPFLRKIRIFGFAYDISDSKTAGAGTLRCRYWRIFLHFIDESEYDSLLIGGQF